MTERLFTVEMRRSLAGNPHTPDNLLKHLLYDEDEIVKMLALENPNTPMEAIIEFAKEEQ